MIAGPINLQCDRVYPQLSRGGCGPIDHHHHRGDCGPIDHHHHHRGGCGPRPKRRRCCGGHHHQPWNHFGRGGRCGDRNYGCGRNNWQHGGNPQRCGNKGGGLRSALEFLNPITGIGNPLVATKKLGGLLGGLFGR